MLAFIPVGLYLKLSHFASHPSGLAGTHALMVCGLIQGLGATLAGAWAWSIATRRLPLALSGQLIASGTIYATTTGLLINQRWPSPMEAVGTGLLFVGVVWAITPFIADKRASRRVVGGSALLEGSRAASSRTDHSAILPWWPSSTNPRQPNYL